MNSNQYNDFNRNYGPIPHNSSYHNINDNTNTNRTLNNPYITPLNIDTNNMNNRVNTNPNINPNINHNINHNVDNVPLPNTMIGNNFPTIVNNQISLESLELINMKQSLKSTGMYLSCPFCKHQSISRVEQQCSAKSVLACICLGGFWTIFQGLRNKDINCYDSDHFCIRCGNKIGEYKSL